MHGLYTSMYTKYFFQEKSLVFHRIPHKDFSGINLIKTLPQKI